MPADRSPHSGQSRPRSDTVQLQDPRDIRALAHPARMAIIDALASGDELTATDCAAVTGLSPSATAYHLKLLERYGFAERAPAREDGRQRPWRATTGPAFDLDPSTPGGAAATVAVAGAYLERSRAIAEEFIATERDEPEEWQNLAGLANLDLWLTPGEVASVTAALTAVFDPYRDRALRSRPEGSRRVRIMTMISPHRKP